MSLAERFRFLVSEGSEFGMLNAADEFTDSDVERDRHMGELLRLYCEIQTNVRTSTPISQETGFRFAELNGLFGKTPQVYVNNFSFYSLPVGYYYTKLQVNQVYLYSHPELLSDEPVRDLTIVQCTPNEELKQLLRNYRMDYLHHLTLKFTHRVNARMVGEMLAELQASQLEDLSLFNIADDNKMIQLNFLMNRKIRPKARLLMTQRMTGAAGVVQTRK